MCMSGQYPSFITIPDIQVANIRVVAQNNTGLFRIICSHHFARIKIWAPVIIETYKVKSCIYLLLVAQHMNAQLLQQCCHFIPYSLLCKVFAVVMITHNAYSAETAFWCMPHYLFQGME
ncbi:hypothetical protein D3C86_1299500 [compost metagenome]